MISSYDRPFFFFFLYFGLIHLMIVTFLHPFSLLRAHSSHDRYLSTPFSSTSGSFCPSSLPFYDFSLYFGHIHPIIVTFLHPFPLLRAHSSHDRYLSPPFSSTSSTFCPSSLPFYDFSLCLGHIHPMIVTFLPPFPLLRAHSSHDRYLTSPFSSTLGTFIP